MYVKKYFFYTALFSIVVSSYFVAIRPKSAGNPILKLVNKTSKTIYAKLEGWKSGIFKSVKKIKPGEDHKWAPTFKKEIKQNVIMFGENDNKLEKPIVLEPLKGYSVTVPGGHERILTLEEVKDDKGKSKGTIIKQSVITEGKQLQGIPMVVTQSLQKTKQLTYDILQTTLAPYRFWIRNVKGLANPALYNMINKHPFVTKEAKVRVGGAVASKQEKVAVVNRLKKAKVAQEKLLGIKLKKPLVIAAAGSGGGVRARLCSTGFTTGLSKTGLLNCITYFAAISGSTWFLGPWLYTNLPIEQYRKRVINDCTKNPLKMSFSDVKGALDILKAKFAFDQPLSFIDLYGLMLGNYFFHGFGEEKNPQRCFLSSIADRIKTGDYIIPIFVMATAEEGITPELCAATPWEFGSRWFGKSGAYIPIWAMGRKFENKKSKNWKTILKRKPLFGPRSTFGFILSTCGSAIAVDLDTWYNAMVSKWPLGVIKPLVKYIMKKSDFKKARATSTEINNFMHKQHEFEYADYEILKLADAAVKANIPAMDTYRRPAAKNVKEGSAPDILFIFDASKTIGGELEVAEKLAKTRGLPFPDIKYKDLRKNNISIFTKNPKGSKFKDYEIPTVIYMPRLLIQSYLDPKKYPELKNLIAQLKGFNMEACVKKTCKTFNFKYPKDTATKVPTMTELNVRANIDKIKEAMLTRVKVNEARDA